MASRSAALAGARLINSTPPSMVIMVANELMKSRRFSSTVSFLFIRDRFASFGLRFGVTHFQSKGPFDAADNVFAIRFADFLRIFPFPILVRPGRVPDVLAMAQGSVKDAALAKFLAPGNGKEPRGFFVRMRVKGQEDMDLVAMKVFEQVNLIKNRKRGAQMMS